MCILFWLETAWAIIFAGELRKIRRLRRLLLDIMRGFLGWLVEKLYLSIKKIFCRRLGLFV